MTPAFSPARRKPTGGIDTTVEPTNPLAKAARGIESGRGRGHVHTGTLHRWRLYGVNGVLLECIKVGGAGHTSPQALQRFFERVTAAQHAADAVVQPATDRPAKPAQAHQPDLDERVEAELDAALGCKNPRARPARGWRRHCSSKTRSGEALRPSGWPPPGIRTTSDRFSKDSTQIRCVDPAVRPERRSASGWSRWWLSSRPRRAGRTATDTTC